MNEKVIIIDYKLSNLFSVQNACRIVGIDTLISSDKNDILNATAIILPGVGAFGDAMSNLKKYDLVSPIIDFVQSGRPFMGICLGLQLLFTESEEFGNYKGLDLIKGYVKRFPDKFKDRSIKVPQIGWNKCADPNNSNWEKSALRTIQSGEFMYFVHSFYVLPDNDNEILSKTNYDGIDYCSGIIKDNIFATQFHPEKSGKKGIDIYHNWKKMISKF